MATNINLIYFQMRSKWLLRGFTYAAFVLGVFAVIVFVFYERLADVASSQFVRRGDYYFNGGAYDLKKAKAYYQWAEKINPGDIYIFYQLARIYFVEGNFNDALKKLDRAVSKEPSFARAYYMRGLAYGFMGRFNEAEADFKNIIDFRGIEHADGVLEPGGWAVYNDLAWIQFRKGNYADVEETARAGLEKYPANPWLLNSLGLALHNLGKREEARIAFQKSLTGAEALTVEDMIRAYPGNDPAGATERLEQFLMNIKFNMTLTVDK